MFQLKRPDFRPSLSFGIARTEQLREIHSQAYHRRKHQRGHQA